MNMNDSKTFEYKIKDPTLKQISVALDVMLYKYAAIIRPMNKVARENDIKYYSLKKPYNTNILGYMMIYKRSSVCNIAKNLGYNTKCIGRYLNELINMGLLTRNLDSRDLRVNIVSITPKGEALMQEQNDFSFYYMYDRFIDGLSEDERQELLDCCSRLTSIFDKVAAVSDSLLSEKKTEEDIENDLLKDRFVIDKYKKD